MRADKEEALRLRVEERLSYKEIQERLGVSKGTLSLWLKDLPLTLDEINSRALQQVRRGPPKKERGNVSKFVEWVNEEGLSRNQKGKIAEAAALLRLTIFGMQAFHAFGDGAREDIVVGCKGSKRHARIQVKWAATSGKYGLPSVSLRYHVNATSPGLRYSNDDFDFLVGYDFDTDTCYVFSFAETAHLRSGVSVQADAAERWDKVRSFLL